MEIVQIIHYRILFYGCRMFAKTASMQIFKNIGRIIKMREGELHLTNNKIDQRKPKNRAHETFFDILVTLDMKMCIFLWFYSHCTSHESSCDLASFDDFY